MQRDGASDSRWIETHARWRSGYDLSPPAIYDITGSGDEDAQAARRSEAASPLSRML